MKKYLLGIISIIFIGCLTSSVSAQPLNISLSVFATGLSKPLDITSTGVAGDDKLFVVQRDGQIKIIASNGSVTTTPFLDIDSQVRSTDGEDGLLGLAFHPNYSINKFFYVFYVNNSGNLIISRFTRDNSNPNLADPSSEQVVLTIDHPTNTNHNGGDLNFGNDGMLYISVGDGGGANDQPNNAQNLNVLLGKILRVNVDSDDFPGDANTNYANPPDNPFVGTAGSDAVWAYGLRNPFRFSFDKSTHDMYIGDVGQGAREEIDFQASSSSGGENYGWRCREGTIANPSGPSGCSGFSSYSNPVGEYLTHENNSCAVTGGNVYRGTDNTSMVGYYLFADYCNGYLYSLKKNGATWEKLLQAKLSGRNISSFGEAIDGEVYVSDISNGKIYKVNASAITRSPLYRLYSSKMGDHFYTISVNERTNADNKLGSRYEGIAGYVSKSSASSLSPFYRLFSSKVKDHLYTISSNERTVAVNAGYKYEGISSYISKVPADGMVPLYRLYSSKAGNHFYTKSIKERNNADNKLGYRYEGIAGYIYPSM
jgi:glucose/arabinose dehydrogenase/ribosomal protein L33